MCVGGGGASEELMYTNFGEGGEEGDETGRGVSRYGTCHFRQRERSKRKVYVHEVLNISAYYQ